MSKRLSDRLAAMVKGGATISEPGFATSSVIADAAIKGRCLWFFYAFGENQSHEHWINFYRCEDTGYYLNLFDRKQKILCTLAPVEDEDECACWKAWQEFRLKKPEATEGIARMKRNFLMGQDYSSPQLIECGAT
jgi:hypothetical protein